MLNGGSAGECNEVKTTFCPFSLKGVTGHPISKYMIFRAYVPNPWEWVSLKLGYFYILYILCACMQSCFSCFWLSLTLWTIAHQAPLSMEFSRQEYWSGLPYPPPGDFSNPGIEPGSPPAL